MYRLTDNPDVVIRNSDNTYIPKGHRLWDEYQEWVYQGNTADEFEGYSALVQRKLTQLEVVETNRKQRGWRKLRRDPLEYTAYVLEELRGEPTNSGQKQLTRLYTVITYVKAVRAQARTYRNWIEDPARTRKELKDFKVGAQEWPDVPTF